MKIKNMHETLRPREKALKYGVDSLSDRELLALMIASGTKGNSALDIADDILEVSKGLQGIVECCPQDFMNIRGISVVKSIKLAAILELVNRVYFPQQGSEIVLSEDFEIARWLQFRIGLCEQEHFGIVLLNGGNRFIDFKVLFVGTYNMSLIHPREIIGLALIKNSTRIILVHNHPQSTMRASQADYESTLYIISACAMVEIEVIDHIIVGRSDYLSMRSVHPELFFEYAVK